MFLESQNAKSRLISLKSKKSHRPKNDRFVTLRTGTVKSHCLAAIGIKGLLCLLLLAGVAVATYSPTDKIFTYQGRLYDNGAPADGEYDLIFTLLNHPEPNQADPVTRHEIYHEYPVSDGFLTVDLNFKPSIFFTDDELFDGSPRWLSIGIRPGELEDPNDYTYIYPPTRLTATPFALLAHRLQTPAVLRSDTNEPVLTVGNEGDGPEINFEGDNALITYDNDATINIVDDYFINIGNSQTRFVGFDSTEDISHDSTITIGADESKTVGINSETIIQGGRTLNIGAGSTTSVTLNNSKTVGGNDTTVVGGVSSISTGVDMNRSAGKDLNLEAGRNINLSADDEIKTLSLMRMMGTDPNQAVLVDGVLNLKSNADFPPANGTYGMLFVKEGKLYYQDDDDLFLITSGGATPQPICFSVKRDSSYDWPENGTPQVIDFGKGSTVWYSVGGGFDPSTSSFTAPTRGLYSFNGSVHFRNLSGSDQIYAELQCGPRTYRGDYKYVRGSVESATVNVTVYLEPGDVVQLRAFVWALSPPVEVFGNISTTHAFTYFNGAKVD